jgi:hypothetical protein
MLFNEKSLFILRITWNVYSEEMHNYWFLKKVIHTVSTTDKTVPLFKDGCLLGCCAVKTGSPDDGGSTDLCNVGKLLPVCTALQPRIHTAVRTSSHTYDLYSLKLSMIGTDWWCHLPSPPRNRVLSVGFGDNRIIAGICSMRCGQMLVPRRHLLKQTE